MNGVTMFALSTCLHVRITHRQAKVLQTEKRTAAACLPEAGEDVARFHQLTAEEEADGCLQKIWLWLTSTPCAFLLLTHRRCAGCKACHRSAYHRLHMKTEVQESYFKWIGGHSAVAIVSKLSCSSKRNSTHRPCINVCHTIEST